MLFPARFSPQNPTTIIMRFHKYDPRWYRLAMPLSCNNICSQISRGRTVLTYTRCVRKFHKLSSSVELGLFNYCREQRTKASTKSHGDPRVPDQFEFCSIFLMDFFFSLTPLVRYAKVFARWVTYLFVGWIYPRDETPVCIMETVILFKLLDMKFVQYRKIKSRKIRLYNI